MNGKGALFLILRLIVQIWLFGMFLHLFGKPALERYLDKKVVVVTSRRETGGTEAPAITLVVRNRNTATAWKKEILMDNYFVDYFCSEPGQNQSIFYCIDKNTYNLSEISQSVNLGLPGRVGGFSNEVKYSWIEDFSYSFMGRTYTLNITTKLNYSSLDEGLLRIELERDLDYYIFVHDLNFFYATSNPEAEAPSVRKIFNGTEKSYYFPIALTEVEELDVPHDHCNTDPNYNFGTCVKDSFSRKVGCRTKWVNTDLDTCSTVQQFRSEKFCLNNL